MKSLAYLLLVVTTGCATDTVEEDGRDDSFTDSKADSGGITNGSPEAVAVLRVANERGAVEMRDHGVPTSAANNIVAVRVGDDETDGTSDDIAFTTLAQLDAVPYVGPHAFARLLAFADELGYLNPAPTPGLTPPADPWNVGACSRLTWAQLAAKFGPGNTRYIFDKPFAIETRLRTSCNAFTGCTPWMAGSFNLGIWPSVAMESAVGGTSEMRMDSWTGAISVLLGTEMDREQILFTCTGIDTNDHDQAECTVGVFDITSYEYDPIGFVDSVPLTLDGTMCADGRYHFVSPLREEDPNTAPNLDQIAIYGRLF